MSAAEAAVTNDEAAALFADLQTSPGIVLAVSGGPDSTALLVLAAHWHKRLRDAPTLLAVTVDHGLRPASAREAADVKRLARDLGIAHRTMRWTGEKPATGLQEAARAARYRLLVQAARAAGAAHILTAHTHDDQAETVLYRFLRGSGVGGLAAMARTVWLDAETGTPATARPPDGIALVRPLLTIPKARLIATLDAAGIGYAVDPSNADPRFTRPRLRRMLSELAPEGLSPDRLALLGERARRADDALEWAADQAAASPDLAANWAADRVSFDAAGLAALPAEIALRLLRRAVAQLGDEGPVELAKLEALAAALRDRLEGGESYTATFRRTLAGALLTLSRGKVTVARAPARRGRSTGAGERRSGQRSPARPAGKAAPAASPRGLS